VPAGACQYFLDIRGAEPGRRGAAPYVALQRDAFDGNPVVPSVYWHVKHYPATGETALQYWFLYLFNDFLDQHESDWEEITVHLDQKSNAVGIFYSTHALGHLKTAAHGLHPRERPLVYVAYGSHANYFLPGIHKIQLKCLKIGGHSDPRCVKFGSPRFAADHANGCGTVLLPEGEQIATPAAPAGCSGPPKEIRYKLNALMHPIFSGNYARGNTFLYGLVPDHEPFTDPQRRAPWKDPLAYIAGAPWEPKPVG
jgi:hypothetical protein